MKKVLWFFIVLSPVVVGVFSCYSSKPQTQTPVETEVSDEPTDNLVGSFKRIAPESEAVQRAYQFFKVKLAVVQPGIDLRHVLSAESQVVAGYKYRLYCSAVDEKGLSIVVYALIYHSLDGSYKLLEYRTDAEG